jgi:HEPN domain-containing protein
MSPAEEAQLWKESGDADFDLIEAALRGGAKAWNAICFHAQHGAEKYLKAYLVLNSLEPPRTHDLAKLLDLAQRFDGTVLRLYDDCLLLNPYAVTERYAFAEPPETTARDAIAAGYRIRTAIGRLL